MKTGWQTSSLGDVLATIKNGLNCKQDKSGVGQKISRIESISQAAFDLSRVGYAEIGDSDKSKFKLIKGDILFSHINSPIHVGKTAVFDVDEDVYHGVNLLLMRPVAAVKGAYLEFFLKYLFDTGYWRKTCKQSVNQASVNQQDISRVPFSFPTDHKEQQRIVILLDEAFDGIATAKAHAEKNLQNARAIFDSHLESVFTDKAKEWSNRLLGDVFHIGSSKRIYETDWTTEGVPFFGGREIVKLAKYGSTESASFISEKKYQEYASKYEMPQADDILMTARGTIGVGYIVKSGDKFYYKDGNVISLRAKSPSNPKFVLYAFRSNAILDQLTVLVGTTVSHLPIEKAKMLKICIPTFEIQNYIVDCLEMMETQSKELQSIYQQKLTALDELKKSLLHCAFNGDL